MRILVALGGNALLRRGEPMTAEVQRANIHQAAVALTPFAEPDQLVLSHGNGLQVGLPALQASAYRDVEPYPLDILDTQTEGMIGYLIEQELGNLLPPDVYSTIQATVSGSIGRRLPGRRRAAARDPCLHGPTRPYKQTRAGPCLQMISRPRTTSSVGCSARRNAI
jgi:carbamate kinase